MTPIDPKSRDVVVVSGADAGDYLQSQLSQEIRPLAVGDERWTFVLEPNGKVHSLARVTRTGDGSFELDIDAGYGEALAERLARFKIRVDVDISVRPASTPEPATDVELERVRVGWPRMGAEIVPGETLSASTGLNVQAVDFAKGCYPGQELVERMDSRGADAPWRLRRLQVEAGASVGDPVVGPDGAEVGRLTSVAGTAALAYVRRGADIGELPVHLDGESEDPVDPD